MKSLNENKKYKGQALAITMVVLVVSALIGLSVYSRSMKDKMLTLEERASAEALEISDAVLEKLTLQSIEDVVTAALGQVQVDDPGANVDDGIVLIEEGGAGARNQISELFQGLGILDFGTTVSNLLAPLCPVDVAGNEYQLTLKTADQDTMYEVRPGHVWALPAGNLLKTKADCNLTIKIEPSGDTGAGFVVSKIYCNYDASGVVTSCEPYELDDIESYCFSGGGSLCNAGNFIDDGNWVPFDEDGGTLLLPMSEGDSPTEIRVRAVGGTVAVGYGFNEVQCLEGLRMFQLRATANCQGVYRGKEILIPQAQSHETIFDYIIFNNEGSI